MKHQARDYTFWGLLNNGVEEQGGTKTLAYLIALVDSPQNEIVDLDKAHLILSWLDEIEEQVDSASELLSRQKDNQFFPKGYFPQTPVMLALRWSPISAMLECGWEPICLSREASLRSANSSGTWKPKIVESHKAYEACVTDDDLFWHVLGKAAEKAINRNLVISVIAIPGWSYEDGFGRPENLTLAEAEKADRVIWQRTPIQKAA